MQTRHLAQLNIGRLIAPVDSPEIAEFVAQLEQVNHLADNSPGFIWRLQSDSGNATEFKWSDDPLVIVNMSVWDSVETLRNFVYQSQHVQVLRDRRRWFEKPSEPQSCLWWVPLGHLPDLAEARAKLEHFRRHGSTPEAFWFSEPHPPTS